jgi:hypothetical protein
VTETPRDDWSPADDPYATAVSEAQWWQRAAHLAVLRLRGRDDLVGGFSSRQIDARQLVLALRQILAAEKLEQLALAELGLDPRVGAELARARQQFEEALPGIKHMRDALTHFDQGSRGEGFGPQNRQVKAGAAARDVARDFGGFGYDPTAETVSMGPYKIEVTAADQAARELSWAIYMAARAVDAKRIAELRSAVVSALTSAGLLPGGDDILISPGQDLRISISLKADAANPNDSLADVAARIAAVLTDARLRLVAPAEPQSKDTAERLARGETLQVLPVSWWLCAGG